MGSIPYRMYDVCKKKSLECKVYWGLFDKISPAFELRNVLGPVPGVGVMAKRPQGLLNVGALSARVVAVLRSCALGI